MSSSPDESTSQTYSHQIKYGCNEIVKLYMPVLCCMSLVILNLKLIEWFSIKDVYSIYTPFHEDTMDSSTKVWHAFANTAIFLTVIIIMTFLVVMLYKYGYMKIIIGFLILSTVLLLLFVVAMYIGELFSAFNQPIDYITVALIVWNNAIVGILVVLWKGPLKLQQAYLVFNSSLMALAFIKLLPDWTTWVLLLMISVWDLVAVLCPKGPLRMLVETAHERGEDLTKLPGLVYSSMMVPLTFILHPSSSVVGIALVNASSNQPVGSTSTNTDSGGSSPIRNDDDGESKIYKDGNNYKDGQPKPSNDQSKSNKNEDSSQENEYEMVNESSSVSSSPKTHKDCASNSSIQEHLQKEKSNGKPNRHDKEPIKNSNGLPASSRSTEGEEKVRGAKLGLGDFVFYSILIGKAALSDNWIVIISCINAILLGLGLTLGLLVVFKKALPALPISIVLGVTTYFGVYYIISPFMTILGDNNIFI